MGRTVRRTGASPGKSGVESRRSRVEDGCAEGSSSHWGRNGKRDNGRQFQLVNTRPLWNQCREVVSFMSDRPATHSSSLLTYLLTYLPAPLYPLQDFKALYKYCIIIIITRLWLDMIIAQSDAHNFDAAHSMLNSNADTETATQLTTPDA